MDSLVQFFKNNPAITIIGGGLTLFSFYQFIIKPFKLFYSLYKNRKNKKDIFERFQSVTFDKINKHCSTSKYIPDTFVECTQLKDRARYFINPLLYFDKIIIDFLNLDFNFASLTIKKIINSEFLSFYRRILKTFLKFSQKCPNFLKKIIIFKHDLIIKRYLLKPFKKVEEEKHFRINNKINSTCDDIKALTSRCMIIKADAGQGKTNFLCDLINTHIIPHKIPCIFFDAKEFNSSVDILEKTYALIHDYVDNKKDVLSILNNLNKAYPFVIIIDSLNETTSPELNINIYRNFLILLEKYNNIKIILTCRSKYYEKHFIELQSNQLVKNKSFIIEHIISKLSLPARFNLLASYKKHFNFKCSMRREMFEILTSDFLLLRIFSEAYQNQNLGLIDNIYTEEVYRKLYEIKVLPENTFRRILRNLCKFMLERKEYLKVNLDEFISLFDISQNEVLFFADNNLFIRRDLESHKNASNTWESISFIFDDLRDYMLSSYLVDEYLNQNNSSLLEKFILDELNENSPLHEGMTKHLFLKSKALNNQNLLSILENCDWWNPVLLKYVLSIRDYLLNDKDINFVFQKMLDNDTYFKNIMYSLLFRTDTNVYSFFNIGSLLDFLDSSTESFINERFISSFYHDNSYSRRDNFFPIDEFCLFFSEQISNTPINCEGFFKFHKLLLYLLPAKFRYDPYQKTKDLYTNFAINNKSEAKKQLISVIKSGVKNIRNECIKFFIMLLENSTFDIQEKDQNLLSEQLFLICPDPNNISENQYSIEFSIIKFLKLKNFKNERISKYYKVYESTLVKQNNDLFSILNLLGEEEV